MIGLVISEQDIAGMGMRAALAGRKHTHELFTIPQDIIRPEKIDAWGAEFLVFLSRHKSEAGKPSLTVHSTGNFGKAEYGGNPHQLQATLAQKKHNVFLELLSCPLDYDVTLEVTHHGPTGFRTPLFFVEIGSAEAQWRDAKAAEFVVDAVLRGLESKRKCEHAIGFGGGHYAPKFSAMHDTAFGHICPKYAIDELPEHLVKQMVDMTADGVDYAVLDEGRLNGVQKSRIKMALDRIGVRY